MKPRFLHTILAFVLCAVANLFSNVHAYGQSLPVKKVIEMEYWVGYLGSDNNIYATMSSSKPVAMPLPGGQTVKAAYGAFNLIRAVSNTGQLYNSSQYNQASNTWTVVPTDSSGAALNDVINVWSYQDSYIIERADSSLWAGGIDYHGLFHNSGSIYMRPTRLSPAGLKFTKVVMGTLFVVGLTSSGVVYRWNYGQGNTTPIMMPTPRPALDISTGNFNSILCIVQEASGDPTVGDIFAWGSAWGTWGATTAANYNKFTDISFLWSAGPWKRISQDWNTFHAISASGALWGAGYNAQGEVGNGQEFINRYTYPNWHHYGWDYQNFEDAVAPTQVGPAGVTFTDIYDNCFYTFYKYAQDVNGNLYSWGRGKTLVLGNGNFAGDAFNMSDPNLMDVTTPTLVTPLSTSIVTWAPTLPVAGAGANQVITTSSTTISVSGHPVFLVRGTDTLCCSFAGFQWTQESGPSTATIVSPTSKSTVVNNLKNGTYIFHVLTTDSHNGMDTACVHIVVNIGGNAPTVSAGSNVTITLPVSTATLTGTATGNGGNTIASYSWSQVSGPSTATLGSAGAASTTLSGLAQGTYVFQLTATDNTGSSSSATVQVIVNPAVVPGTPVASAGSTKTITLPTSTVTLTGSGSETNGTIASYAWTQVSGPSTATLGSAGSASTSVSGLVAGTYSFKLTVTDALGVTASATVQVTVNAAVVPGTPVANAGSNQTITLPTNSVGLTGSGSETNGSISSYAWTQVSGPSTATFGSAGSTSTSAGGLVQGTYTFKLTVTDALGVTASATVQVTVNAALPGAPVANAGNNQTIVLPTNSATLSGSGSETNGSIASYAWTRVSGPTVPTFSNASSPSTTVSGLVAGTYSFKLTVTDALGVTASATVQVIVNPAPGPGTPTVNAGSDQTITLPTNSVTLSGSGSETNGAIASYAWTRVSGPTVPSFGSAGSASTTVSGLVQGTYWFELTVTDAVGVSASATVEVTVNPPVAGAPSANAGSNQTITLPTNSVTLSGSGSETNGTIVSYTWTQVNGPSAATFGSAGSASTTVSGLDQGTYTFKLTVTDALGVTANATVQVVVDGRQPPVANAGPNQTTSETTGVQLNGSASYDPAGTIVGWSWTQISGLGGVTVVNATSATPTLMGLRPGVYVFQVTVTDDAGLSASATVTVTVTSSSSGGSTDTTGNSAVVAVVSSDTTVAYQHGDSAILNGSGSYATGSTIASYHWVEQSGPTAMAISDDNGAVGIVSGMQPGDYVFRLTVTNANGDTSSASMSVHVMDNERKSGITQLSLYPNPVSMGQQVTITGTSDYTGTMKFVVMDMNGHVMQTIELAKEASTFTQTFGTSGLSRGVYLVVVQLATNQKPVTVKFVVQ